MGVVNHVVHTINPNPIPPHTLQYGDQNLYVKASRGGGGGGGGTGREAKGGRYGEGGNYGEGGKGREVRKDRAYTLTLLIHYLSPCFLEVLFQQLGSLWGHNVALGQVVLSCMEYRKWVWSTMLYIQLTPTQSHLIPCSMETRICMSRLVGFKVDGHASKLGVQLLSLPLH